MVNIMIYLDNAATTKVYEEAVEAMLPYFNNIYSNPSEIYAFATDARKAVNKARKQIAGVINASPEEIYFTSGGTESDNWALFGILDAYKNKGRHIITSGIEHHAILNSCARHEKNGVSVTYVLPDENGIISPETIEKAIKNDTVLISIMAANNEIGTIQNIKEISEVAHRHNIIFHTDAVQAFAHIPIDVKKMNIDMLSASSHKCHGPKGIGFLYVKNGIKITPFHNGGRQERTMRAGTENVPGIVGFGMATEISNNRMEYNTSYLTSLRNHFISRVLNEIEYVRLNGDRDSRLPGNVNFGFAFLDGEAIQIQLDLYNICCSTGSACNAGVKAVSHVLSQIKVPEMYIHGSVRFTISEFNTLSEIDYTVNRLKEVVEKLRSMSIEYKMYKKRIGSPY